MEYVISAKLDGVSGLYTTEGDKPRLYTRGNGTIGHEISHLIPYLDLPKEKGLVLRGEFIISKKNFDTHFKGKSNPRNTISGLINKIKVDTNQLKYVDFIIYECIKPDLKPSEQFKLICELTKDCIKHTMEKKISNELLSKYLVDWRKTYEYEIDGIITTHDKIYPRKSKNPEHSFAFKMLLTDQIAEAKVLDVEWNIQKDGYIKPRIRIEPVKLGGVTITYATAFNAGYVEKHNIGIGALIKLVRSGDVIPHIAEVTTPADKPKMPDVNYTWNKSHIDIIVDDIENNKDVISKRILLFFTHIKVDSLKKGNITKLINGGYDSISKIINITKEQLLGIDGFKEKTALKLYTSINEKIKEADLITIMTASNIFGRGFGDKRFKLILSNIPDILTSKDSNEKKIKDILDKVEGMGEITTKTFVENIDRLIEFLKKTDLIYKLDNFKVKQSPKKIETDHELNNKKILFTGFTEKTNPEFYESLMKTGAVMSDKLNKELFAIIAKDINSNSKKAKFGKEHDILYSIQQFTDKYLH